MPRCCEKVLTPVMRPSWRKSGDPIRYSMVCSPTLTASGSTTGRPWSVRRCWKSTPFDVETQGSLGRVPVENHAGPEDVLADDPAGRHVAGQGQGKPGLVKARRLFVLLPPLQGEGHVGLLG